MLYLVDEETTTYAFYRDCLEYFPPEVLATAFYDSSLDSRHDPIPETSRYTQTGSHANQTCEDRTQLYHMLQCGHMVKTATPSRCAPNCVLPNGFEACEQQVFACPGCVRDRIVGSFAAQMEGYSQGTGFDNNDGFAEMFLVEHCHLDMTMYEELREALRTTHGRKCMLVLRDSGCDDEALSEATRKMGLDDEQQTPNEGNIGRENRNLAPRPVPRHEANPADSRFTAERMACMAERGWRVKTVGNLHPGIMKLSFRPKPTT